ncbi:MAG: ornithine cyclodeaminase family protein [Rhodobacteraceae bacterium]|nr:ornithine cyclodeaminase family protein [Paracoccaceae bacterium]
MIYISEEQSAALASHELAYAAAKKALMAAMEPGATIFPVLKAHGSDPQNIFGVKSSSDKNLAGLKVGSYFPTNDAAGLARHGSIILLYDQSRGRISYIVEAGLLNAYRTAASDAVATDTLARKDASVMALFGTGHQAEYEAAAIAGIRNLSKILVVGRTPEKTEAFVNHLREQGLPAERMDAESACRAADIIVTATTATEPLFDAEWVQPGTHVSSMGSDAPGKQELPPELFQKAKLFCDLASQSRVAGDFQHAEQDAILTPIGRVLMGETNGQTADDQITVFDSSGISLQDLYMAEAIIGLHQPHVDLKGLKT